MQHITRILNLYLSQIDIEIGTGGHTCLITFERRTIKVLEVFFFFFFFFWFLYRALLNYGVRRHVYSAFPYLDKELRDISVNFKNVRRRYSTSLP